MTAPGTTTPPAVGWETQRWDVDPDRSASRRARLRARGPYRSAIPASLATAAVDVAPDVAAESAEAAAEIARFDEYAGAAFADPSDTGAPGAASEFAPLAAVMLRTESASSSQIEHVTAGARALALATLHEKAGPNARLVAGNVEAMRAALALSEDISTDSLLAAHAVLLAGQDEFHPGAWRPGAVWIGSPLSTPHTATFVPPRAERVPAAMADLIAYCARTDVAPLAQAAIAHAQIETIHPFADGNGRVGRVLVHAMLRQARVTRRVTTPISAGLLVDTASYFDALGAFRDGDASPIVERFSAAVWAAVDNGRELVEELRDCYRDWHSRLPSRRDSAAWRLLPELLRQPAVNLGSVREATGVSQPAAHSAVSALVEAGILTPAKVDAQRNRVWLATEVVGALDAFAARAGRRGVTHH